MPTINLSECSFKNTILKKGTILYRAVDMKGYKFQPDDSSLVRKGRFNEEGQYAFYMASNPTAAIMEYISYCPKEERCIVNKYKLLSDLTLVDLNRWTYPELKDRERTYPKELIIINQHITCPRRDSFDWLYSSTQLIANYFRKKQTCVGIMYQTAVAHSLQDEKTKAIYKNSKDLINYAIFKTPDECSDLFADIYSYEQEIPDSYHIERYRDEDILRQIKVRNSNEQISGLNFNKPEYEPSLPLYKVEI